jgi:hypothetical protein
MFSYFRCSVTELMIDNIADCNSTSAHYTICTEEECSFLLIGVVRASTRSSYVLFSEEFQHSSNASSVTIGLSALSRIYTLISDISCVLIAIF